MTRPSPPIRRAGSDDCAEVVRLVSLMYDALGVDTTPTSWHQAVEGVLSSPADGDAVVLVVDDPGRGLAAVGGGSIATRLPGPATPTARVGYLQWVSTDPRHRRRGLARAVAEGLLAWFLGRDVTTVELHPTSDGEHLYRSLGFADPPNPTLRLQL